MSEPPRIYSLVVLASAVSFCLTSCPGPSSPEEYSGILQTDSTGIVIGGDAGDWTLGSAETSAFTFGPAYPNPSTDAASLIFSISRSATCRILLSSQSGQAGSTIASGSFSRGIHVFEVPHPGKSGIYRVTFESDLGNSYGDIEFK
jgi:hypothetical protein